MNYIQQFFLALDVLVSSLATPLIPRMSGVPRFGITVSARCGIELRKAKPAWWARAIGKTLNFFWVDHCEHAVANDRARAWSTLEYLQ